jgi:Zn-dependent protease/CBS domain-containing protein
MKWSWKIANVAGIDVYLHMTFLILIVWIGLGYWQLAGTVDAVVSGVSFILALFFCVLLHEFGHALTARQFGIRTKSIMLLPIGGIASIEKMPEDPRQEIIIALAGPAVSSAIALVLWILLRMGNGLVPLEDLSVTGGSFLQRLMIVNILLAAFNMLPAFPMDGGRVFRALLSLRMEPVKATRIAAAVAQAFALLMAVVGFRYNLFLVFIAVFIWIGAVAEARMANVKFALSGLSAGKAMLTDFQVLQPDESLAQAVKLTLSGTQKDFPVLAGDKVVGVLRQSDLLRGLHDHGKLRRVDQEMQGDVPQADISEPLEAAMERMQAGESGLLIVTDGSRIAGIIDIDNITELLRIQKALQEHDEHRW